MYYRIVVYLACCALPLMLGAQQPQFKPHYAEAWSRAKIRVMHQDAHGWIWLGTQNGLFRYDGIDYDYFQLPDTVQQPPAVSAIFDHNDTLWVGFETGQIAYLIPGNTYSTDKKNTRFDEKPAKGQLFFWQPEEGTPKAAIRDFTLDQRGNRWIATYGEGIYVWMGRRLFQFDRADDGLCSDEVYAISSDHDGQIWVATDNGISRCSITPDGQKTVNNLQRADGLPDEIVTALAVDPHGQIWMGTHDHGCCVYDRASQRIRTLTPDWPGGAVTGLARFDGHETWLGNADYGLLRLTDKGQLEKIAAPVKPRQLLQDREGMIWVLGENGTVYSLNPASMAIPVPEFKATQAICTDAAGHIWAANQQGLRRQTPTGWAAAGPKANIISLAALSNGEVWAGTFGEGICAYGPDGRQRGCIRAANGLANGSILSLCAVGGQVWAATLGGVVIIDPVSLKVQPVQQVYPSFEGGEYYVYKIFADSKGRIWCCTDGHGLCVWADGQFQCWQEAAGIPLKTVYSIAEDAQGKIWFSGEQTSLFCFDGKDFRQFTTQQHLHSANISSLAVTGNSQLVIGYTDGIDLMDTRTGHVSFFGTNAGVSVSEASLNAATTDAQGNVWLGCADGLQLVPAYAQTRAIDPAILIKSISNLSGNVGLGQNHRFAYHQNHLVFEYAGLWHTNPASVYYRYKLEGFDPDWTISKDHIASYPNLPPGQYVFHVQASEHGHFEGTAEATYAFTIRRPFWAEWWFVLACLLGIGLLARAFLRTRERRLRLAQDMENEKIVAQLDVLKTQINPHFLFNSLNTLVTIIEENPKLAVDYVQHLSDFYRSILAYREKNFIPLEEELEIVQNFGFLLKKRFEDALQIEIDVQNTTGEVMPLSLQLLLENAVKHNVMSKKQPLQIRVYRESDYIVVQNNKNAKIKPEPGTRFGLQILQQRSEVLVGKPIIIDAENGSFIVKIPIKPKQ